MPSKRLHHCASRLPSHAGQPGVQLKSPPGLSGFVFPGSPSTFRAASALQWTFSALCRIVWRSTHLAYVVVVWLYPTGSELGFATHEPVHQLCDWPVLQLPDLAACIAFATAWIECCVSHTPRVPARR
eukprot:3615289-Amphidinium_carterae.6